MFASDPPQGYSNNTITQKWLDIQCKRSTERVLAENLSETSLVRGCENLTVIQITVIEVVQIKNYCT